MPGFWMKMRFESLEKAEELRERLSADWQVPVSVEPEGDFHCLTARFETLADRDEKAGALSKGWDAIELGSDERGDEYRLRHVGVTWTQTAHRRSGSKGRTD